MQTNVKTNRILETMQSVKPYGMKLCRDKEKLEDLMQDFYILLDKYYNNVSKYDDDDYLRYCRKMLYNLFCFNYRKNTKLTVYFTDEMGILSNNYSYDPTIENDNEKISNMKKSTIKNINNSMKDIYSKPLEMYVNGKKYVQISEELGLPLNTVKTRIRRAKKKLKL